MALVLIAGGASWLSVGTPARSQALAPIVCQTGFVYGMDQSADANGTRNIWSINTATGVLTSVATLPGAGLFNALAVDSQTSTAWAVAQQSNPTTIYRVDTTTGVVTSFPAPTRTATVGNIVMGASDPTSGIYYYGGLIDGTSTLVIYAFDTNTNTAIAGEIARVSVFGSNGDFAFDAQGRLYIVSSDGSGGRLTVLDEALPTTGSPTGPTITSTAIANTPAGTTASLAFGGDGYLYTGVVANGVRMIYQLNPSTGAIVASNAMTPTTNTVGDFASCAAPNTIQVIKNLPDGRYNAGDQFTVSVTGGGLSRGNTGTTAGSEPGVQDQSPAEVAGPVLGLVGETYSISETGASGAVLTDYVRSWSCINANAGGAVVASGTGSTGAFVMPGSGTTGSEIICTFTNKPLVPGLTIDKRVTSVIDANGTGVNDAGDKISFAFDVVNTGTTTMSDIVVNDPMLAAAGITVTCPATTLAPGASTTCTAATAYTITQADVNNGAVVNTATASGTPPNKPPTTSPPDSTTTPVAQHPAITLEKVANRDDLVAGDTITYTYTATNTGDVTLSDVVIAEDSFTGSGTMSGFSCTPGQPARLAPAETLTCTTSYVVTQADVDAGRIANTASTTGTPPTGPPVRDTDDAQVPGSPEPGMTLVKRVDSVTDVNGNGLNDAGDEIDFVFDLENTGNTTLTDVTVDDPLLAGLGITITCDPTTLAPGESVTCVADEPYVITQADVDAGEVENVATATATPPPGTDLPPVPPSGTTTPTDQDPAIALQKVANRDDLVAGETITYTYTATNTGNVTLTDVAIAEDSFTGSGAMSGFSCTPAQPATLAPGEALTCTTSYVVTQADVDAGQVANVASTTGTPPTGPPVTDTDDAKVPGNPAPGMTLVKRVDSITDVNGNGLNDAGDEIDFVFDLENIGNTTLTEVTVDDPLLDGLGISISCDRTTLAPGESVTCTADAPYVITQADVDAGSVENVATATATPPPGTELPPVPPSSTVTPTDPAPGMTLAKRVARLVDVNGNGLNDTGDKIYYEFDVANTGNTTLTEIRVSDPMLDDARIGITCDPTTLAPGESVTCVADEPYVITAADTRHGSVRNVATATGTPPPGTVLPPTPPSEIEVPTDTPPAPPGGGPDPDDHDGFLPNTGGPTVLALVGGLALVVVGGALLLGARRQRRPGADQNA